MSSTIQSQDNDRRGVLQWLSWFTAMMAVPAVSSAAEPQDRYWVVPYLAAKMLELRPVRPDYVGPYYPGEDGQRYSQDDVMRGVLTLLLRMNGVGQKMMKK